MAHGFKGAVALAALLMAAAIPAHAAESDPVVARVNGTDIHRSALQKMQQSIQQHGQVPLEKVYDQLIDQVILDQVILEQAKKQKLENDPVFKAQLEEVSRQLLQQFYLTKRAEADVSEDAVKERFEQIKATATPKEEVKVRHIVVSSEEAAKAVIADLQAGTSFEDEAKAKSLDPSGKANGGELGYITKEKTVPEFSAAAFQLKPGEYTQTPVHSQFGWHVIMAEDHRMSPPPSYEAMRGKIKMELIQQDMQKIVDNLLNSAQIQRFNMDGSPRGDKPKS